MERESTSRVCTPPAVTIASRKERCPVIRRRTSLSQSRKRLRSSEVIWCASLCAGMRVCSMQTGIIFRGRKAFKIVWYCCLPWASRSRSSRASSLTSSKAGLRSMESPTSSPSRSASTTCRLRERMIGPETPKWVKSISPKASACVSPSTRTRTLTLRKLKPCSLAARSPAVSSGTSAGRMGMMVCPTAFAKR